MELSITLILIIVTVVASFYAWNDSSRFYKMAFNPYEIQRKQQYYRFISSGLIHSDYIHLFFNMYVLYSFGTGAEYLLEAYFPGKGLFIYLGLYVLGMIVADIPSYLKHRHNPGYNAVGASGAVSAVVFAIIIILPLNPIRIFFIPIDIPGFIIGILYLIYSYYESNRSQGRINHDAHLFGALFGIGYIIVLRPAFISEFFEQLSTFSL